MQVGVVWKGGAVRRFAPKACCWYTGGTPSPASGGPVWATEGIENECRILNDVPPPPRRPKQVLCKLAQAQVRPDGPLHNTAFCSTRAPVPGQAQGYKTRVFARHGGGCFEGLACGPSAPPLRGASRPHTRADSGNVVQGAPVVSAYGPHYPRGSGS